jgi:hypothetical protein
VGVGAVGAKKTQKAHEVGFVSVLVGKVDRKSGEEIICHEADLHFGTIHELEAAIPGFFGPSSM